MLAPGSHSSIAWLTETSPRVTAFSTPRNISDEQCTSVLAKKNGLLSEMIEANQRQAEHLDRRRALRRVVSEIEGHGLGMQHPRKVFNGLFSEICQLRYRQRVNPGDGDQLPVNAIDAMPDEVQDSQQNGIIYENGTPIARAWWAWDGFSTWFVLWFIFISVFCYHLPHSHVRAQQSTVYRLHVFRRTDFAESRYSSLILVGRRSETFAVKFCSRFHSVEKVSATCMVSTSSATWGE